MANEIKITVSAQDNASKTIEGIKGSAIALGAAAGVLGAQMATSLAGAVKDLATMGVSFNAMKEQAQIAFTTMLGDGQKAKSFLDELQSFAARTPFEFPDLLKAAQRLQAMGFESERVIPLMTSIGDAVAGLGGGAETINRVTIALGQVQARGKAAAQEMLQLTEAGIPAWQYLADSIGKSVPQAMKLVEKGAIDAETTIAAVTNGMNRDFGGLMQQQSKTFNGLISTLKDNARIFAGEVTKPLFDDLKDALVRFMAWFEQHREQIKDVFEDIFTTIREVVKGVAALVSTVGPILWDHFGEPVWEVAKRVIQAVRYIHDNWREIGNAIIGVVEDMVNGIIEGLNKALDKIGDFIEMIRKVPFLGDKLGIPEGQVLSGAIGEVSLGRIQQGTPQDFVDDAMNVVVAATKAAKQALPDLSASIGDVAESGKKAKDAMDELAERMARAAEAVVDKHTNEIVEAYMRGGDSAVAAVRGWHATLDEQWTSLGARLKQQFGIEVPDEFRSMWEQLQEEAEKGRQAIVLEEQKLAKARLIEMTQGTQALIDFLAGTARNGGGGHLAQFVDDPRFGGRFIVSTDPSKIGTIQEDGTPIVSLDQAQSFGWQPFNGAFSQPTTIEVNFNGLVTDPVATGQAVADALNQAAIVNGPVVSSGAVQS